MQGDGIEKKQILVTVLQGFFSLLGWGRRRNWCSLLSQEQELMLSAEPGAAQGVPCGFPKPHIPQPTRDGAMWVPSQL